MNELDITLAKRYAARAPMVIGNDNRAPTNRRLCVMLTNKHLAATFELADDDTVIRILENLDKSDEMVASVDDNGWQQTVGRVFWGTEPDDADAALSKLNDLEIKIRTKFAIPSARPGGDRSKGTGFKLHPRFKSYKSVIKAAFDSSVELLDEEGNVRPRNVVANDVKNKRYVDKTPEEKLTQATSTWLAIFDMCDPSSAVVKADVELLVSKIIDAGFFTHIDIRDAA